MTRCAFACPGQLAQTSDPADVRRAAAALVEAKNLVVYAGQGIHYARAWESLKELAEVLSAPVATSLQGKSAFPEDHPLALGAGGNSPPTSSHFLEKADLIFGIGCSFTETTFGIAMPHGKRFIHATLDPKHLNKDIRADIGLIGDARLTLDALLVEIKRLIEKPRRSPVTDEIAAIRKSWLNEWMPKLTSDAVPLSPYRVIWDLQHTVDVANTIITHDAGSPRDQLAPFWITKKPFTYISSQAPHAAGIRPRPCHGREARLPGKTLRQCLGRCRHRLYGHGFRDCRARADSDSLDTAEQFQHGYRRFRSCPFPPNGFARRIFLATTPRWRAPSAATANGSPSRAKLFPHPSSIEQTQKGVPAAPRIHPLPGTRCLEAIPSSRLVALAVG